MNFLLFGAVSFAFFATFPLSLVLSLLVLGVEQTKQLLFALLEEFLQTLLIMLCALATLVLGYLLLCLALVCWVIWLANI